MPGPEVLAPELAGLAAQALLQVEACPASCRRAADLVVHPAELAPRAWLQGFPWVPHPWEAEPEALPGQGPQDECLQQAERLSARRPVASAVLHPASLVWEPGQPAARPFSAAVAPFAARSLALSEPALSGQVHGTAVQAAFRAWEAAAARLVLPWQPEALAEPVGQALPRGPAVEPPPAVQDACFRAAASHLAAAWLRRAGLPPADAPSSSASAILPVAVRLGRVRQCREYRARCPLSSRAFCRPNPAPLQHYQQYWSRQKTVQPQDLQVQPEGMQ